ncbi:alpha/beta hydrolase [Mycolicibacterium confluentis]|nr:alpha/beta hydrolase [Mycolicibacterium confluentis]MCV7322864.1 alpha/beta hydrolase [Mycolicibacterium confluentis]ORV20633.1 alpha/beta hydrolase [Mycolicibacterium confluentis]
MAVETSRHRVHPDLRQAARIVPRSPIRAATLPLFRVGSRMQKRLPAKNLLVLTTSDGVEIRLHRPAGQSSPGPAMLWLHGGGFVIGTAAQDDHLCRRFTKELGITTASVEYGLSPENRHPTALEQCHSALTWLARLPSVDPDRIVIAGGSAGGGLAAQLAFLARDRGEVTPVAQHLVYPMLDDRTGKNNEGDNPGFRLWDARSNQFGWQSYLGDADPNSVVPARRTDLAGLPPAWIGVGTLDLFHDEDLTYAERLHEAGVPCTVDVVEGAFHGFDQIAPQKHVSRNFFRAQCASLRAVLG